MNIKVKRTYIENIINKSEKYEIMAKKDFPCTICGTNATVETILSKALLNGKMTSETTNRIINCPICGNVFIPDLPYLLQYNIDEIKQYVLKNPAVDDEYNCFVDMSIYVGSTQSRTSDKG